MPLNLTQYGIKGYFNPIVLSSEYGRQKPDPSIFHDAARLANSPTSECVYIGDRIARDISGSKRAGYKLSIQIQHDIMHGELDEGATPDFIIKDMTELLEILRSEEISAKESLKEKSPDKNIRAVLFDADGVLYYRKNKNIEFNKYLRRLGVESKENPDSQLHYFRRQAFIGRITYEQYKTAILKLYGITDPVLISRGIQISLEERDKFSFSMAPWKL